MVRFGFVGLQNGDEGKGKFVEHTVARLLQDIAINQFILNMRYQGSSNAGHTVKVGDKSYALHQIPGAIIHRNTFNFLGTGMYLNVPALQNELQTLTDADVKVSPENLGISSKTHIVLPYHTLEDAANFNLPEHSSTGNGVRQAARDKYNRVGIRAIELLNDNTLLSALERNFTTNASIIQSVVENSDEYSNVSQIFEHNLHQLKAFGDTIAPYLHLEETVINDPRFAHIINEGAQGMMLDIDKGQYPGITSSNPGLPPYGTEAIIGILKFYQSSVGIKDRAFVAEMNEFSEDTQKQLRDVWNEYGTTTGRPRHIGWFDTLAANYALASSGANEMAGSCLDRLEHLHELGLPLKVVTGYKVNGQTYTDWDIHFDDRNLLFDAKPIYKEFATWNKTLDNNGELTPNADRYVDFLENALQKEFYALGVGPESTQTVIKNDIVQKYAA